MIKTLLTFASCLLAFTYGGNIALGPVPDQLISWTADSKNITFQITCQPNPKYGALSWCAFGINSANGTAMAPGAVMFLSVGENGVAKPVEDRVITVTAEPPCSTTQISYTLASHYDNTTGILSATVTRPLKISAAARKEGLVDITNSVAYLLGANGNGLRVAGHCALGHVEHYGVYNDVGVNFLSN